MNDWIRPLTRKQKRCINHMMQNGATLFRHPGGYWTAQRQWRAGVPTYGTSTVEGLVMRGLALYTEWRDGRRGNGPFPVEIKLVTHAGCSHVLGES